MFRCIRQFAGNTAGHVRRDAVGSEVTNKLLRKIRLQRYVLAPRRYRDVPNAALDGLTKGLTGLGSVFGSNAKQCEKLVEATAKELEALGL